MTASIQFCLQNDDILHTYLYAHITDNGQPTAFGRDLCIFLNSKKIEMDENIEDFSRGFGCLVAQFCSEFKYMSEYFYITHKLIPSDYKYLVICNNENEIIIIFNDEKIMNLDEFNKFLINI